MSRLDGLEVACTLFKLPVMANFAVLWREGRCSYLVHALHGILSRNYTPLLRLCLLSTYLSIDR